MTRRRKRVVDEQMLSDARKLAAEHDLAELERRARQFVRADSVFTWTIAGLLGANLVAVHLMVLTGFGAAAVGPLTIAVLAAVVLLLAYRHGRIRDAFTLVLAHRLRELDESGRLDPKE